MTDEAFWELFTDTGDPVVWLLYRAADEAPPKAREDKKGAPDETPAATG